MNPLQRIHARLLAPPGGKLDAQLWSDLRRLLLRPRRLPQVLTPGAKGIALLAVLMIGAGLGAALFQPVWLARPWARGITLDLPALQVLPPGSFLMGSPPEEDGRYDNEAPRHPVEVGAFALAIAPVTRAEYAVFVADTGHVGAGCWTWNGKESMLDPQADWHAPGFPQDDTHPVVCVNWDDAQAYVKWLSKKTGQPYRLPTEAEWEYAARAGSTSARYWGDDVDQACGYANVVDRTAQARVPGANSWTIHNCSDGYAYTAPANFGKANGFGLRGMLGNVWQWTEDCWHDNYRGAPVRADRAWGQENGGQCGRRGVRGGGWISIPRSVRAAVRNWVGTTDRGNFVGFRVARTLP